jgi:hypothetical protein
MTGAFEMYEYEVILPGLDARPPEITPGYHREKTLGPMRVGQRLSFANVESGVVTMPEIEWEIEHIDESPTCDGRLILRRLA